MNHGMFEMDETKPLACIGTRSQQLIACVKFTSTVTSTKGTMTTADNVVNRVIHKETVRICARMKMEHAIEFLVCTPQLVMLPALTVARQTVNACADYILVVILHIYWLWQPAPPPYNRLLHVGWTQQRFQRYHSNGDKVDVACHRGRYQYRMILFWQARHVLYSRPTITSLSPSLVITAHCSDG